MAGKVRIKDMLRQLRPDLQTAEFRQIVYGPHLRCVPHASRSDDTIDTDLLDFMTKQIITNYKFGVLYQRAGQTEEDQVGLLSCVVVMPSSPFAPACTPIHITYTHTHDVASALLPHARPSQWYNNVDGSSELEEFLTFLGDRITLNGWNKFRGGLSVTGTMPDFQHYVRPT